MRIQKIKYTRELKKGMLLVLNRIYSKLPKESADYILIEASDFPGFRSVFVFEGNEVTLKPRKVVEKMLMKRMKKSLNSQKKVEN